MTSVPLFSLNGRSPSVLGELRELLFPVSHGIFVDNRGSEHFTSGNTAKHDNNNNNDNNNKAKQIVSLAFISVALKVVDRWVWAAARFFRTRDSRGLL